MLVNGIQIYRSNQLSGQRFTFSFDGNTYISRLVVINQKLAKQNNLLLLQASKMI